MNGPADPRVNPHHPDHEHDWHGDYDNGRYVGDVCRCGAEQPARPRQVLVSGCGADCGQAVNRAEPHTVVLVSTELVEPDGSRAVDGAAEAAVYHPACLPDVQAALAPAPAAAPREPSLRFQELLQDTYACVRLLRTSQVPRDRALAQVLLGVRAQLAAGQQQPGRPLGLLPVWTRRLIDTIADEDES